MDDRKRATFLRGLLLAWVPCVFFLFRRWIPDGLDTAVGSRALYAIPILPCEVAALFFLLRSFSRRHPLRTLFTGVSALWSVGLITVMMTAVFSAISAAF
jgi:hypothetical protein